MYADCREYLALHIQRYARPRSGNLPTFFRGGGAGVLQRTIQAPIAPALERGGGDGDVRHTLFLRMKKYTYNCSVIPRKAASSRFL